MSEPVSIQDVKEFMEPLEPTIPENVVIGWIRKNICEELRPLEVRPYGVSFVRDLDWRAVAEALIDALTEEGVEFEIRELELKDFNMRVSVIHVWDINGSDIIIVRYPNKRVEAFTCI